MANIIEKIEHRQTILFILVLFAFFISIMLSFALIYFVYQKLALGGNLLKNFKNFNK